VRALIVKDRLQMESILKMEARSRLDTTIIFAVDQEIREQLFEASKRKDQSQIPIEVKEKLLSRMRTLNDQLTTFKADILIAVDREGIVIGQIGENERSSGYSLNGFPLVQAALRGYLMDDSWFFDGKLFRMSARPVIHGGIYVGALIHGQKMSKDFADLLARATDSQVGVFVEDHIIAVAVPAAQSKEGQKEEKKTGKKGKAEKAEKKDEENSKEIFATDAEINTILMDDVFKDDSYTKTGRSTVLMSKDKYFVVAMKMVGEARMNNAGLVLIRQVPKVGGVSDFIKSIRKEELAAVSWWQIAVLAVSFLLIGVLIIYLEGDRPKSRFLKEVEKMVAKEGERLNIYLFRGKDRKLADAINRAIDKAVQVLVSKATSEGPSVSKILGATPGVDHRLSKPAFEIPGQISLDDIPPPPPAGSAESPAAKARKPKTPTIPAITLEEPSAEPARPSPPKPAPGASPKPQPPQAQQKPGEPRKGGAKDGLQTWGGGLDEEETRIYEGDKGPLPQIPSDARVPHKPAVHAPAHPPAAPPAAHLVGEEELFRKIYEEFYKTKVACGENVDNLTLDRFKATLKKQEEAIKERTKCRKVEFRVYVKDGKAALKASPIK